MHKPRKQRKQNLLDSTAPKKQASDAVDDDNSDRIKNNSRLNDVETPSFREPLGQCDESEDDSDANHHEERSEKQ